MSTDTIKRFTEIENQDIRKRAPTSDREAQSFLDNRIEHILSHRAVEHPFLAYYSEHGLPKDKERLLFLECCYFFRYLPFYIAGMAMSTRDENIFREILHNVVDEIGVGAGDDVVTHSQLYRRFLAGIGIPAEDVDTYRPLAVTTALNEGIKKLYSQSDIFTALGALFADETMSGIMVSKLNDGLKLQGYDDELRYFWTLHIEVEIGHSNGIFNAIAPYIKDPEVKTAFDAGTAEFLRLLEAYWDGVEALVRSGGAESTRH